jgi:putative addiction module component (TIGR02574 family)
MVTAMAVKIQSYERLEKEALHLARVDRSKLASKLLESLDEDDFELSPQWREELRRRVSDIDSGKAKMIPAEDLWNEVNQRFGTTF